MQYSNNLLKSHIVFDLDSDKLSIIGEYRYYEDLHDRNNKYRQQPTLIN